MSEVPTLGASCKRDARASLNRLAPPGPPSQPEGLHRLNDPGYAAIKDGGANRFPLNPLFDYIGLNGFLPLEPTAQPYGALAPTYN